MNATSRPQPDVVNPQGGYLFEQAPRFLALLEGPRHVFQLANRAYRNLVGDRPLIGLSVADAFPELAGSPWFELLDDVLASGQPHVGERVPLVLRESDTITRELFVDFVDQPILSPDGTPQGIFVQGHDITTLVAAEQNLAATAREMSFERQIFDMALSFTSMRERAPSRLPRGANLSPHRSNPPKISRRSATCACWWWTTTRRADPSSSACSPTARPS